MDSDSLFLDFLLGHGCRRLVNMQLIESFTDQSEDGEDKRRTSGP
jgi:hypothetical protein